MFIPSKVRRPVFLAAALLFIAIATLVPGDGAPEPFTLCVLCGIHGGADAVLNVLLFFPLGVALALNGRSGWRYVFLAALLSACIELAQFIIPGRDPSIGDVTFNTVGAALGLGLIHVAPLWQRPDARVAGRLSILASGVVVFTFALSGWLFTPDFPATGYHAWWKAEVPAMELVRGRFLRGAVGPLSTGPRNGPLPADVPVLLAGGAPLNVTATAGLPPPLLQPLFAIRDDHRHEIVLLAMDRTDFVLRYRLNAARLHLDQPDLRLHAALRDVTPTDTLQIEARRAGRNYCLRVNRIASCELGFTLGDTWKLLFYPRHLPFWLGTLLDGVWLAGLAIPIGFWARTRWESGLAVLVLGAGLVGVPTWTGLAPTQALEFMAVFVGGAAGVWLGKLQPASDSSPNRNR